MDGASSLLASTNLTRLLRSAPDDPAARRQFVVHYGQKIFRWCRALGLAEPHAEDLTRTITARLVDRMHDFVPDPGRNYCDRLWNLTEEILDDFTARARRKGAVGGEAGWLADVERIEARRDLRAELAAEFQLELIAEAKVRARARVSERQWEAFRMTVIEGVSGAEAAGRIGMGVASVYNAKSKVIRMIQDEVHRLNGPDADDRQESARGPNPAGDDLD